MITMITLAAPQRQTIKGQKSNKEEIFKSRRPLYITRVWRRNKEILIQAVVERNSRRERYFEAESIRLLIA